MTQHTQEPWSINEWPQADTSTIAIGAVGTPLIARVYSRDASINEWKANADRIVACVNACEGIDNAHLNSPDNLATYARNMALQRDEAHKQLYEIRALVGAETEELIQDAIKRLIAERDQCKADFEAQFSKVGA